MPEVVFMKRRTLLQWLAGVSALLPLDFLATAADLDFPFLAELHELFFAAEDGRLAQAFGLALCLSDDSPGRFFCGRARLLLAPELRTRAQLPADKEKNRAGNSKQKYASYG